MKNISTQSGKSSGAVPLIPIATGNPQLDKQIQQFYSCKRKTGHTGGTKPEPSRNEVNGVTFRYLAAAIGVVVVLVVVAVLVVMAVMAMDINTVKKQISKLKVYQR